MDPDDEDPEPTREVARAADDLIRDAGVDGDPDLLDELAGDLLEGLSSYRENAAFGLLVVDEIRRRADLLRLRPQ